MQTSRLLSTLLLLGLSACAPVILGRTPTPAAPGVTETSLSLGYPFGLTEPPLCEFCEYIGPAYWPLPLPVTLHVAYGRTETIETNVGLMVLPYPSAPLLGVRYGAKERVQEEPVELAFDYGGALYLTNVGFDAGVLAATPLGEAKLYGALRGFGTYYYASGVGGAVTLTVGGEVPTAQDSNVMLELSLLTNLYNGVSADSSAQPVGFSLVPAISFTF